MKKTFELALKLKTTDKVFKEKFGPGVVVVQRLEYDFPEDVSDIRIAAALLDAEAEFIKQEVEIKISEIA